MTSKYSLYALFLIILIAAPCFPSEPALLPLPKSLQDKHIYYRYTKQLNDWSCGYNALYNAVN